MRVRSLGILSLKMSGCSWEAGACFALSSMLRPQSESPPAVTLREAPALHPSVHHKTSWLEAAAEHPLKRQTAA